MPSNNEKYTEEMREQTAKLIIETGKSATSFAEEIGIDVNTVCRWVRDYRRKHKLPSYAELKGIKPKHPVWGKTRYSIATQASNTAANHIRRCLQSMGSRQYEQTLLSV